MNKKNVLLSIVASSAFILTCRGLNQIPHLVNASKSPWVSSLDTTGTIFYSPTSEEVLSYYENINEGDYGDALLSKLQSLLKVGQKKVTYSSGSSNGSSSWLGYYLYERDYVLSPLTQAEIDANRNNNKTYTTSGIWVNSLYSKSPIYIETSINTSGAKLEYYTNWDIESHSGTTKQSNTFSSSVQFDREHVFPKSYGFNGGTISYEQMTAGCDAHNLHIGEHNGNSSAHSNFPYGEVLDKSASNTTKYTSGITGECVGYVGLDENGTKVYEPNDEDKGDIARSIFYMCARYHDYEVDPNNSSTHTPRLSLTDLKNVTGAPSTKGPETTENEPAKYGQLSTLLKWNKEDPVSDEEIRRNDLVYKGIQNNRNPFIDFPSWADACFGEESVKFKDINIRKLYLGEIDRLPDDDENNEEINNDFTLVESVDDLVIGSKIIIASKDFDVAMSSQKTNNRDQSSIVKEGKIIKEINNATIFTLQKGNIDGTFAFKENNTYLYAAGSSKNNYLKSQSVLDNNGSWTITINGAGTSIVSNGDNTNNIMKFNSSNSNNLLFSCYGSSTTNMKDIVLYQKSNRIISDFQKTRVNANLSFNFNKDENIVSDKIDEYVMPTSGLTSSFGDNQYRYSATFENNIYKLTSSSHYISFKIPSGTTKLDISYNAQATSSNGTTTKSTAWFEFYDNSSNSLYKDEEVEYQYPFATSNYIKKFVVPYNAVELRIKTNKVTNSNVWFKDITITTHQEEIENIYSDYSNVSMAFSYNFDFTKYDSTDYTKAGYLVIKNGNIDDYKGNSVDSLPSGSNYINIEQTNFEKDSFLISIKDIPSKDYKTNIVIVPYILVDGVYYYGEAREESVYSILNKYYETNEKISLDGNKTFVYINDVVKPFIDEIDG